MFSTLPNILTFSRILAIPVVIGLLLFVDDPLGSWLAFATYTYACITDFFDGYLARAWHLQSAFGRFLDPIADKLLIASILLVLVGIDRVSGLTVLPAAVILCREILVSGLREFLAEVRVSVPVTTLAKWKTTIQMLALGFLMVGPAGPDFGPLTTTEVGIWGLWGAAVLTLVTGYDYLVAGLKHIVETDHAPADKHPAMPGEDGKDAGGVGGGALKIFGLVGWSGSGKTTLFAKLVPELISRGFRVSTMKHTHHNFDIDKPGKDSYEHRIAGAAEVLITGSSRWALLHENRDSPEPSIDDLLARMEGVDLVLIEGFKSHGHRKMEVHRPSVGKPLLAPDDPSVVAVASDADLTGVDVPVLPLDDVKAIADFIINHVGLVEVEAAGQTEAAAEDAVEDAVEAGKKVGAIDGAA